ncbi:hypothetical protein TSUD_130630 [Trifolium subterraneum]|nr:hypothetical protein TSUD_130630 [Trifolium subterraneum]
MGSTLVVAASSRYGEMELSTTTVSQERNGGTIVRQHCSSARFTITVDLCEVSLTVIATRVQNFVFSTTWQKLKRLIGSTA